MKRSYLDYAMSVIVSRALPDVRDGLKPVHRRILYRDERGRLRLHQGATASRRASSATSWANTIPMATWRSTTRMVRMAQDFSMRLPLIDGQGNFGSMDGDPPAAMRYTEARLARAAMALLDDIDKDTVDFQPNYDEPRSRADGAAGALSRTCWSTAPAASPSAWRPTSRPTIWAR